MPTTKEGRRRRYERHRTKLHEAKDQPCGDCGQHYPPRVMDFHHREPATKLGDIATMLYRSWAVVEAEIAKCDLLCANCHRMR